MIYLKSIAVGLLATVIYAVLVPLTKILVIPLSIVSYLTFIDTLRKWHVIPNPNSYFGSAYTYARGFHLSSPLYLFFGALIFVAVCYWEFRRLRRNLQIREN